MVGIGRAIGERGSTRYDGLISANVDQSTITEVCPSGAEGVCGYVHGTDLICEEIVLSSPGGVVIDGERIVFYLVNNVDLVRITQVDLLGRDSRCTNLLETTEFVAWGDMNRLPWVLGALTLRESRPEGTISGRSGLD